MNSLFSILLCSLLTVSSSALASMPLETYEIDSHEGEDELDPFSPNVESHLEEFDKAYEEETGLSPFLEGYGEYESGGRSSSCKRQDCKVWAHVSKANQTLDLYIDGVLTYTWDVSTGAAGHGTPNFDRHPDGRIYDEYSSSKYPGGDYKGLGNMPYAVFIQGGFAIHGTPEANWPKLGGKASHGCIRVHPDNAYIFNRLVRTNGIANVWVTVD